jgi:hypothetical protein
MFSRILIAGLALSLGACASFDRRVDDTSAPRTFAAAPYLHSGRSDVIQYDLGILLGSATRLETPSEAAAAMVAFRTGADPEARRNELVGALLLASDRNCDIYMENLRGAQSTWRTSLSVTDVVVGAAGSMFDDGDTAGALSGLSGVAGSLSGKLDEGLMGGAAANVLLAGVRAAREPIRTEILGRFGEDYASWPVSVAIADVMQYHGRCNVVSALTAAQTAAEQVVEEAIAAR